MTFKKEVGAVGKRCAQAFMEKEVVHKLFFAKRIISCQKMIGRDQRPRKRARVIKTRASLDEGIQTKAISGRSGVLDKMSIRSFFRKCYESKGRENVRESVSGALLWIFCGLLPKRRDTLIYRLSRYYYP